MILQFQKQEKCMGQMLSRKLLGLIIHSLSLLFDKVYYAVQVVSHIMSLGSNPNHNLSRVFSCILLLHHHFIVSLKLLVAPLGDNQFTDMPSIFTRAIPQQSGGQRNSRCLKMALFGSLLSAISIP